MEFHGDLFELRNRVIQELTESDFLWLSDYSGVDLLHDLYGLEVTGIPREEDADVIKSLLCRIFPKWKHVRVYCVRHSVCEPGWKVMISQYPESFDDPAVPSEPVEATGPFRRTVIRLRDLLCLMLARKPAENNSDGQVNAPDTERGRRAPRG